MDERRGRVNDRGPAVFPSLLTSAHAVARTYDYDAMVDRLLTTVARQWQVMERTVVGRPFPPRSLRPAVSAPHTTVSSF